MPQHRDDLDLDFGVVGRDAFLIDWSALQVHSIVLCAVAREPSIVAAVESLVHAHAVDGLFFHDRKFVIEYALDLLSVPRIVEGNADAREVRYVVFDLFSACVGMAAEKLSRIQLFA